MKRSVVQEESPLSQPMASINSPHVSIGNTMNAYSGHPSCSTISPSIIGAGGPAPLNGQSSPNFGDFQMDERREPSQSAYIKSRKIDFTGLRQSVESGTSMRDVKQRAGSPLSRLLHDY